MSKDFWLNYISHIFNELFDTLIFIEKIECSDNNTLLYVLTKNDKNV